uniref:Uncharacterized protein n=1 Tax=Arundo donax TaxID=35708 RepID=A0A0A9EFB4_ARUDO
MSSVQHKIKCFSFDSYTKYTTCAIAGNAFGIRDHMSLM